MPWRKISEKQFQVLYDLNIPQLYRAALVMFGDQQAAERAAADAFLQTVSDPVFAGDARVFSDQALRLLCRFCRWETVAYDPAPVEAVGISPRQADMLSRCTPNERILIALSTALEFAPSQIAALVGWPKWLVSWRLQYLERGMQAERRYFQEEDAFLSSHLVNPF